MKSTDSIGVIFDMDGVLVDSAESHYESWKRLAEECGGSVTREQFTRTFGRQNCDIIPILFGDVSDERSTALADRKEEIYRELIRSRPPIVEGAPELVRSLHDAGVRLAIGSSAPRENITLILDAMGVTSCVSAIVSGDDHERGKPDPQVFQLAVGRLGLEPSRCVVLEDAPLGVQAARAAGTRTVAVLLYHTAEAFDGADDIVSCLGELSVGRLVSLACM